ncbi:MAG: hypothetical protein K0R60_957 [Microbacterium sp.]|jgi:hypothetical protein|nr:hypothetical protein [Microbacterium sp.]
MSDPDPVRPVSKPIPIPSFRPTRVFRRAGADARDDPRPDASPRGPVEAVRRRSER